MYTRTTVTLPYAPWGHIANAYVYCPPDLDLTKKYPLLICDPGQGELGSNLALLENATGSIPNRAAAGTLINPKTGKEFEIIFLCLQPPSSQGWAFDESQIASDLSAFEGLASQYPIDVTKIGVTGYSSGGEGAFNCLTQDVNFAKLLCFIAPISSAGLSAAEITSLVPNQAASKMTIFSVCGTADAFFPSNQGYINTLNAGNASPSPVFTPIQGGGHWSTQAYDPKWTGANGLSLYDTFLSAAGVAISGGTGTPPPPVPSVSIEVANGPVLASGTSVTITYNGSVIATAKIN